MDIKLNINIDGVDYTGNWNQLIYRGKQSKFYIYLDGIKLLVADKTNSNLKYHLFKLKNEKKSLGLKTINQIYPMNTVISYEGGLYTVVHYDNDKSYLTSYVWQESIENQLRNQIKELRNLHSKYVIPQGFKFESRMILENNKTCYCKFNDGIRNLFVLYENYLNEISDIFANEENLKQYIKFKYNFEFWYAVGY